MVTTNLERQGGWSACIVVRAGFGVVIVVLLLFGMVGCGSSEPHGSGRLHGARSGIFGADFC